MNPNILSDVPLLRQCLKRSSDENAELRNENEELRDENEELRRRNSDREHRNVSVGPSTSTVWVVLLFAMAVLLAGGTSPTLRCLSVGVACLMSCLLRPQLMAEGALLRDWVEAHRRTATDQKLVVTWVVTWVVAVAVTNLW